MTKIIFNNEPPSLDPYILDWDISVFHKEEKLFIFQSIELIETKENNSCCRNVRQGEARC